MAQVRACLLCTFLMILPSVHGGLVSIDTDPPQITCEDVTLPDDPPNLFFGLVRDVTYTYADENPDPSGISYSVHVVGNDQVNAIGYEFPLGVTEVTMTAVDTFGNAANCDFRVTNNRVEVSCTATDMTITIPYTILQEGDKPSSVHLQDNQDVHCRGRRLHSNIRISTPYEKCGTTVEESGESIIYSNAVIYTTEGTIHLNVPVKCIFEKNIVMSGDPDHITPMKTLSAKGYATFNVIMERQIDDNFGSPANPHTKIWLGQELAYLVYLEHITTGVSLFIESCWATPKPDPDSTPQYFLIKDGCEHDSTTNLNKDLGPRSQGFSFSAFTFIGDTSQVYLHCSINMCVIDDLNSRCNQGCIPNLP